MFCNYCNKKVKVKEGLWIDSNDTLKGKILKCEDCGKTIHRAKFRELDFIEKSKFFKKYVCWIYNRKVKFYEAIVANSFYMNILKQIIDDISRKNGKFIEIGAGTGLFTRELKKKLRESGSVYALDISSAMLKVGVERAIREGLNLFFIRADAENLPFPNEVFDEAVCIAAINEFPDREKALKEIYRILKNNSGIILLAAVKSKKNILPLELKLKGRLNLENEYLNENIIQIIVKEGFLARALPINIFKLLLHRCGYSKINIKRISRANRCIAIIKGKKVEIYS